jgi:LacI family transcriptional regulator, galactose operon repressor
LSSDGDGETPAGGRTSSGERRPTLADVALKAGVSQSTASRALSGGGYISPRAAAKVRRAAESLRYVPNDIARSLKGNSTRVIGMVIDDLSQAFFAEVAAGIEAVLRKEGYRMILAGTDGVSAEEEDALERFAAIRAEGVVLAPATPDSPAIVHRAIGRGIPIVEVDRRAAPGECDAVLIENERGGYVATRHLIDLGHRRIAICVTPFTTGEDRFAGYRSALIEADIPFDPRLVAHVPFHPANPEAAAGWLLDANPDVTAIFATNNILTGGVLQALKMRGRKTPVDVSVVGFDDVPWMSFVDPPVTTVAQPAREIGAAAARLLLDRIGGSLSGPPTTRYLQPKLLVRESTGPLPTPTHDLVA